MCVSLVVVFLGVIVCDYYQIVCGFFLSIRHPSLFDFQRQPSRFDTAKYEQMLSQMYNPKNYETQLVDKPFGSHEYASAPQVSNTGSYGSSYSTGVNGQASHSSAGKSITIRIAIVEPVG